MKTFRELAEAKNIYRNEKSINKWSFDETAKNYVDYIGNTICGIGILAKFAKAGQAKDFIFVYLGRNEKGKGKEFKDNNKNKAEELVRYVSRNTANARMAPLCVLNAEKGYMRFMENIDEDPELEDAQWSKPEKFDHLRTIF